MADPVDVDLDWKVEEAILRWLNATDTHHKTLDAAVMRRHFEQAMIVPDPATGEPVWNLEALPVVIVEAARLQRIHPQLANYKMHADVTIVSSADGQSDADFQKWKKEIEDILNWDALASALSDQLEKFMCNGIVEVSPGRKQVKERHWESTTTLILMAQPND